MPRCRGCWNASAADQVDAVFISHGHPDHCADLNPLLRARALRDQPPAPLPVYAPPGALTAVLALDRPGMLDDAYLLREFSPGDRLDIGPFRAETRLLPHWLPNAGLRLAAGGRVLAYTGDSGPSPDLIELARGSDIFLAEASYTDQVPEDARAFLSSARQAGQQAAAASAGRLMLTHLLPGTSPQAARAAAAAATTARSAWRPPAWSPTCPDLRYGSSTPVSLAHAASSCSCTAWLRVAGCVSRSR